MKTCPKCGELNGNSLHRCFKCGTYLSKNNINKLEENKKDNREKIVIKKICPICNKIYSSSQNECSRCGETLQNYPMEIVNGKLVPFTEKKINGNDCMSVKDTLIMFLAHIVTFFCPKTGLRIFGKYCEEGDNDNAESIKFILFFGLIVGIVIKLMF